MGVRMTGLTSWTGWGGGEGGREGGRQRTWRRAMRKRVSPRTPIWARRRMARVEAWREGGREGVVVSM